MANKKPLVISHPSGGFLAIGDQTVKKAERRRTAQLGGSTGASVRIFEDGGWDIRSTSNDKGSSLVQTGKGPLSIYSEGDLIIDVKGTLSMKAKDIIMESKGTDGDIVLNSAHDIRLDAGNNVKVLGTMVGLFSDSKMILASQGWNIIRGNPLRFVEPKSKLIPTSLLEFAESVIENFLLT
jgi:hypothetical protein